MYISFVPSALIKYTFFHCIQWNRSRIHDKHLNILYISSQSFIKDGRKPENPGKNHLTIRKQNLAFPRDPSEAQTTEVRNLMDQESALLSSRLRGPSDFFSLADLDLYI